MRYLQPDPTDLDGVHTYAYANGDPVDEVDLAGLFTCPSGRIAHDWGWIRVSLPGSGKALHAACEELDHLLRTHGVAGGLDPIAGAFNFVAGDDIHTAFFDPQASAQDRAVAMAMLVLTVVPEAKLIKLLTYAPWVVKAFAKVLRYVAESAHVHIAPGIAEMAARLLQKGRVAIRGVLGGCTCFPVGTLVATPGGLLAINALQPGQPVLAEDPTTGVAEPEVVQAVIDDGVKPLLAVDLSDGEAITVTADHPFYVDRGALLGKAGWLHAGDLWPGDRLRTADGKDVTVVGLRRNVGRAEVYTLTVAHDHTFFVGAVKVLVHNGMCSVVVRTLKAKASSLAPGMVVTDVSRASNRQGFVAEVTYAGRRFVVRIMRRGGPRQYYWRVSRMSRSGGGSTIDISGKYTTDIDATHIPIGPSTAGDIIRAIVANVTTKP